ncbi:MAG: S-layer homology domain-containing protein [Clostridiales bacterium]|nr:S-layer homology domain-containing protein [Clostridiales bacterium]
MKLKIMALITALTANFTCASAKVIDAEWNPNSVNFGEESVFEINVSADKLTGIQFDIIYDAKTLEYVQSSMSDTFKDSVVAEVNCAKPGIISALAAFAEGKNVEGKMCEIKFKAIGTKGESKVRVDNIKLMIDGTKQLEEGCTIEIKTNGSSEHIDNVPSSSGSSSSGGGWGYRPVKEESVSENMELQQDIYSENELSKTFSDISGHWAKNEIELMLNKGIVSGMANGTFAPDQYVTRAEFAAILAKALRLDDKSENVYIDVKEDAWYTSVVLECTKAQLIIGNNGKFRPNEYLAREEMAAIISRAKEYVGMSKDIRNSISFSDANTISSWAQEAVADIAGLGIINGYEDGTFRPHEKTTRAHAAVVISKFLVR